MTSYLFRFRGEMLGFWAAGTLALGWPPRGFAPSVGLLLSGLALRAWARRHIGPHSRGRILACPERSTGGPYRFLNHPLYAANLLVISALALALTGPRWEAAALIAGPALLYLTLARAESAFVRLAPGPERMVAHDRTSGGWRSEWASTFPQIALWALLQFLSSP